MGTDWTLQATAVMNVPNTAQSLHIVRKMEGGSQVSETGCSARTTCVVNGTGGIRNSRQTMWSRTIHDVDYWKKHYTSSGSGPHIAAMKELFSLIENDTIQPSMARSPRKIRRYNKQNDDVIIIDKERSIDPEATKLFVRQSDNKSWEETVSHIGPYAKCNLYDICLDVRDLKKVPCSAMKFRYVKGRIMDGTNVAKETFLFATLPLNESKQIKKTTWSNASNAMEQILHAQPKQQSRGKARGGGKCLLQHRGCGKK